jgi:chorismate mutase/prephenate dehydratase
MTDSGDTMNDDKLSLLRMNIDELDLQLLSLLNKRMSVSQEIGDIKKREKRETLDACREEAVLNHLINKNNGPLLNTTLKAIYREIFSGSRSLQRPIKVAYLGPAGTFSHHAATVKFGDSSDLVACNSIEDVFLLVSQDAVTYGIVPIENSIEGSVRETMDSLMNSSAQICGEFMIKISHDLMSKTGKPDTISRITSHPQALAQCRKTLAGFFPGIPQIESESTAVAGRKALDDPTIAVIGSESLGKMLGLIPIRKNVQDRADNFTRFFMLSSLDAPKTGNDKTSIVFWTDDRPGALYSILKEFAEGNINLTRIESRPDKGALLWKYAFFLDFEGHRQDENIERCLEVVSKKTAMLKVLGSYPLCVSVA